MSAAWFVEAPAPEPGEVPSVRPYVMTTGRTGASDIALQLQTVVATPTTPGGEPVPSHIRAAEHTDIVGLCLRSRSVAQIAVELRIPLGVARVLVADLLRAGQVATVEPQPPRTVGITFLERLRAGVAAL